MRIAVLCPSDIATRRFLPALRKVSGATFFGTAVHSAEERFGRPYSELLSLEQQIIKSEAQKAEVIVRDYGGTVFGSYAQLCESTDFDAVYIPLPPALHVRWVKYAIAMGKSVLVEKPATLTIQETNEIVALANKHGVTVFENYAYAYHEQIDTLHRMVSEGNIGDVRLYRLDFGFPMRQLSDFRYNKELGGGALNDAGGYTLSYAMRLLGESACVKAATLGYTDWTDTDVWGSGMLCNNEGQTAQVSFGMDNQYRCDFEAWGSRGTLKTGRVFTAPDGFTPKATLQCGTKTTTLDLPSDDSFLRSIEAFMGCVTDIDRRVDEHARMIRQAMIVQQFRDVACAGDFQNA